MVDDSHGPQGEGPRYQPEFSGGERLSRLEALYEAFRRTEIEWQEQLDRRFQAVEREVLTQHNERIEELASLRREFLAASEFTDKAINKAGEAQEKQNTLTRDDALRARESMEERVRALERGESQGLGRHSTSAQTVTWAIAAVAVFASVVIAIIAAIH